MLCLALGVIACMTAVVVLVEREPGGPRPRPRAGDAPRTPWWRRWSEAKRPPVWVVRSLALPALGLTVLFFVLSPECGGSGQSACPGYALASPWVLRGERGLGALVGALALVVVVARVLAQGRVPDTLGRDGAGWAADPDATEGIANLEKIVQLNEGEIGKLREAVAKLTPSTPLALEELSGDIRRLSQEVDALKARRG